ncbi:hypothetical protein RJ640_014501 [Escallonia rubra]|uniref:Mitotic checkpoint serine/threonine-protein kinase BUB1 n=1 Tax=Escallonia rubra TaxID=112253 RepID=A0AA88RHD6_9ASTE|nr:hypothetical protein RJ640_014501 [Escallonia rubra]
MGMAGDPVANATNISSSNDDPLLPWLRSIKKELDDLNSREKDDFSLLNHLVSRCIGTFKHDARYRNDVRFLKIWILYIDGSPQYESVFREMEEIKICLYCSLLYECYALFLEAKGKLSEALSVYELGISSAQLTRPGNSCISSPLYSRLGYSEVDAGVPFENGESCISPWSISTIKDLLQKMNPQILKYEGYHASTKDYSGKVKLSSLQKSARNKVIEIGGKKYQIKGCAGQGGFAQVFKAYVNSNPDDVVALKIQKPPFPWEFYMYRQLDSRIPDKERLSFGHAHRLHLYSDYSILVSDYLGDGTLQDAINSNVVIGGFMEEVLCIYYTIEMLIILEILHGADIIHGDFKPDNLLIYYSRDDLAEDGFRDRTGPWRDQGLCLVDWGRGIDLSLFPDKINFVGDCRTSGFRCIEMQENKPWKFQASLS